MANNTPENSPSGGQTPRPDQEEEEEDYDYDDEAVQSPLAYSGLCGCLAELAALRWRHGGATLLHRPAVAVENDWWVVMSLKKAKEVSELAAGPRWKNFIRRLAKFVAIKNKKMNDFSYDPRSYALNFDDHVAENQT